MATGWAQVYRDNPQLIEFIATDGRETMDEYAARRLREAKASKGDHV